MVVWALALEVLIIAGSGLDADGQPSEWMRRWAWWHLAPFYGVCVLLAYVARYLARRACRAAAESHQRSEASRALIGPLD